MDESTRLRMRRAHANHAYFCSCGKIVHGNGGKANHAYMHEQKRDGHRWLIQSTFYERYPNAKGAPMLPSETHPEYVERMTGERQGIRRNR